MLHCYTMRKNNKVSNSPLFPEITSKACKHRSCDIVKRWERKVPNSPPFQGVQKACKHRSCYIVTRWERIVKYQIHRSFQKSPAKLANIVHVTLLHGEKEKYQIHHSLKVSSKSLQTSLKLRCYTMRKKRKASIHRSFKQSPEKFADIVHVTRWERK